MSTAPRSIFRSVLHSAVVALLCAPIAGAQSQPLGAPLLPPAQDVRDALGLTQWSVQALSLPTEAGAPFRLKLELDGLPVEATLLPRNLMAPGFKLLVQGADGTLHEEVPAAPTTYQGQIDGFPESLVAGSLIDGQLSALLRLAPGETFWGVQPASAADPQAPHAAHVVYDSRDTELPEFKCGTPDVGTHEHEPPAAPGPGDAPGDKVCQIACDADFEYFQANGASVAITQNDITNIINGVEAIYHADCGILYEITQIIVRTTEPDPYTTTTSGSLLNQFQAEWNANQGAVVRDVAHLFTGKNLSGSVIGIAQLSVICSIGNAYGLVQSKYTGNFTNRVALSAHELGHNWSAQHCDSDPSCSIMCSGLGGCSGNLTSFNTSSKNQIINKKNAVGCLSDPVPPAPPLINTVTPGTVKALAGTLMTINGTFFNTTTQVLSGGQSVGFTLVSDNQITYIAPNALALGTTNVVVTTEGGTSNTKTFNTVETNPPGLMAPPIGFSFTPFIWTYGGGVGDFASLLVGLANTTFNFQGQNILLFDIVVFQQTLTGAGIGSASLSIPAAAAGITFYSQVVTLDGPNALASNIIATIIFG